MSSDHNDDPVGYGRPPKAHRFQKGRSGNPSGRPKAQKTSLELFRKELSARLSVQDQGRSRKLTKAELIVKQYVNRAFIATYQDLGYLEGDVFTILSPVRRFEQYRVVPTAENPHNLEPMETENPEQVSRAIGYYQTSSAWNKR